MQRNNKNTELLALLEKCNYNLEDINYIKSNFGTDNSLCLLRQIYASLDLLEKDNNEYLAFYNLINRYFKLDCKILDVCCGHLPILSDYIRRQQIKIGKGTVTSVDINLVVKLYGKINKLYKGTFDRKIIQEHDLIISQAPCDKFDEIVGTSLEYNKGFFVSVCNCNNKTDYFPDNKDPFDDYDFDPVLSKIYSYINEIVKNQNLQYETIDFDTRDGIRFVYGVPKKKILK